LHEHDDDVINFILSSIINKKLGKVFHMI